MKSCGAETAPVLRSMVAGYFLNTARQGLPLVPCSAQLQLF
jgi:hypothetical protein